MTERSEQELLDDLAGQCGIAPDYYDIWGRRHEVSAHTKRAILDAMGLRVGTVDALRNELSVCEEGLWRSPCDPVLVRQTDDRRATWSFRLPVEGAGGEASVTWEVHDEAGCLRHQGESGPGLTPSETRVLGDRRYARFELPVPEGLPPGYYDLFAKSRASSKPVEGALRLILVPTHCYVPPRVQAGGRVWGLALQLYSLRSSRNWGAGDLRDLAGFVDWAAQDLGAAMVGLNPLHALTNERPYHISPYSPDSRLFLNVLYVAIDAIPELQESDAAKRLWEDGGFRARLDLCRQAELVDYDRVFAAKREILALLFAAFQERHVAGCEGSLRPKTDRGAAFAQYVEREGRLLEQYALFQALSEEFRATQPCAGGWRDWPEPYRDPHSEAVASFRDRHLPRVRFHQYLQWLAEDQLRTVADRTRELEMPIGLYHDFALGSDRTGSDAWMFQDVLALEADSGCPPDDFAPEGQNWGLPPMNPLRLRASGYRMFTALLRKNLAHGGALRLDHVMGLFRLFWIPRGMSASEGAYVHYPVEDLLGIVALESMRSQALIVGEDLGTVPDSVRERLAASRIFSYKVFYFEQGEEGRWKAPGVYPEQAVAVATTHDLPTLSGFWIGRDIETRARLGSYPDEASKQRALDGRWRDKGRMLSALRAEGLLPEGATDDPASVPRMTADLCLAIHRYLAMTPSRAVMASIEDWLGETEQTNLPGTIETHPNWSRKMRLPMETLRGNPVVHRLAAEMRRLRPAQP